MKTTTWKSDELSRIEAAQELEIAPRRGRDAAQAAPDLGPPFSSDQKAEIRRIVEVNLLGAMTATEVRKRPLSLRATS